MHAHLCNCVLLFCFNIGNRIYLAGHTEAFGSPVRFLGSKLAAVSDVHHLQLLTSSFIIIIIFQSVRSVFNCRASTADTDSCVLLQCR